MTTILNPAPRPGPCQVGSCSGDWRDPGIDRGRDPPGSAIGPSMRRGRADEASCSPGGRGGGHHPGRPGAPMRPAGRAGAGGVDRSAGRDHRARATPSTGASPPPCRGMGAAGGRPLRLRGSGSVAGRDGALDADPRRGRGTAGAVLRPGTKAVRQGGVARVRPGQAFDIRGNIREIYLIQSW